MRWLTVGVPGEPGREILLERPGPPAMDDATADQVRDLVSKGASGTLFFSTDDVRATWDDLKAKGVGAGFPALTAAFRPHSARTRP